jgi:hypothetical protein
LTYYRGKIKNGLEELMEIVALIEIFGLICNAIVLISAVLIAIKTIAEMIGRPIRLIKRKSDTEFKEKVISILDEILPGILLRHDLETRERYKADREAYLRDIKEAVVQDIGQKLSQVDNLAQQYVSLEISAKDVLREKIVCMYENNKDARKLRYFEKRALEQYYKDYKKMGGNSYIDTIHERMLTWEVEPDDYQ